MKKTDSVPSMLTPKEAAGLYDPGQLSPLQKEYGQAVQENEALMAELRKSVYGTVGVNINGQEMEVPLWNKGMTPAQAEDAARDRLEMGLHPFTPQDQLEKAQDDEQARPTGYSKGTNNVKKTDSVPAMLTPKEAILNRNAAELLGRDAIKRLNAHGNMLAKRGVDLASDPTPGPSTQNLLGYQYGTAMVGRDDRADLLADAENTFYGGGQVPAPTPTPTPTPRMYQYGTYSVDPRHDYAPYGSGAASPRTIKAFMSRYGVLDSRGNITTPTPSGGTATVGPSNRFPQPSGGSTSASRYSGAPSTYGSQGILGPDQNPAYQAALARNPTPASRYAAQRSQPFTPQMVGTYGIPSKQRAVVTSGPNSFRTYDPQGGYIGRTGNATDFLNRQFNPVATTPIQPAAPVQPIAQTQPVANMPQNVVTTPTSVAVNTGQQFQPYNLEPNPFTQPSNLTLEQPRRYSDYY